MWWRSMREMALWMALRDAQVTAARRRRAHAYQQQHRALRAQRQRQVAAVLTAQRLDRPLPVYCPYAWPVATLWSLRILFTLAAVIPLLAAVVWGSAPVAGAVDLLALGLAGAVILLALLRDPLGLLTLCGRVWWVRMSWRARLVWGLLAVSTPWAFVALYLYYCNHPQQAQPPHQPQPEGV